MGPGGELWKVAGVVASVLTLCGDKGAVAVMSLWIPFEDQRHDRHSKEQCQI